MLLHEADVLGQRYRYRLLSRRELRVAFDTADNDQLLFEELVFSSAVVELPEDFPGLDNCLAGVPTEVCKKIMQSSGYLAAGDTESPLEASAVEWAMSQQGRADMLICFCFPTLNLETLEDLDPEVYCKYSVAAQVVASGLYGLVNLGDFLDPTKDRAPSEPRKQRPPNEMLEEQSPHSYLF